MSLDNSYSNSEEPHSKLTPLLYALPAMPLAFLFGPIAVVQGIYAKYFGLSLTTIATILFISRIFDAFTDPIIGHLSDRYYARSGSYKPFIILGVLMFLGASWFLFVPFNFSNVHRLTSVSPIYFLFWFLMFYLGYTLFEVPHLAWGNKLAESAINKNKIYGLRSFFALSGSLCFYLIPLLPMFETNEITPQTLKWSVVLVSIVIVPILFLNIKMVPKSTPKISGIGSPMRNKINIIVVMRRHVFRNRPLATFLAACCLLNLGFGMWATLLFIFVDSYIGLGEEYAVISIVATILGLLSIKGWYQMGNLMSKKTVWIIGVSMMAAGMFLTAHLTPAAAGVSMLGLCVGLNYIGLVTLSMMAPSLLSDIADYGSWKFGSDCAGIYFSFYLLVNKTIGSLGGAFALALVGWYGFDPKMSIHGDAEVLGLRMAIGWIPILLMLFSILFICKISMTNKRHAIVRRRLDSICL